MEQLSMENVELKHSGVSLTGDLKKA